eukprot:365145-Chlamydomonas_euryale.AAC.13
METEVPLENARRQPRNPPHSRCHTRATHWRAHRVAAAGDPVMRKHHRSGAPGRAYQAQGAAQ